jgi:chromosome segregation ATPase
MAREGGGTTMIDMEEMVESLINKSYEIMTLREDLESVKVLLKIESDANNRANDEIAKRDDSVGKLMRQIDGVCCELADKMTEVVELNERVDAFVDLVKRMADELGSARTGYCSPGIDDLLDEAEAMTGRKP